MISALFNIAHFRENLDMEVRKLRSVEREAELDLKIQEIRRKNEIIEEQHRVSLIFKKKILVILYYFASEKAKKDDVIAGGIEPPTFSVLD